MKRLNKFLTLITLVSVAVITESCEKNILEVERETSLSGPDAAQTAKGAQAIVEGAVTELKSIFSDIRVSVNRQCGTDIVRNGTHLADEPASGLFGMNTYDGNFSAQSEQIESLWNRHYNGIVFANTIISALGNLPDAELGETGADNLGQAYTMRAYLYLELVRRFDNIPIIDVRDLDKDGPQFETEQSQRSEVYSLILSDLNKALPIIRTRAEVDPNIVEPIERPTRGLTLILLTEANLDLGNNAAAAAAADELVADPSYLLQPLDNIFGLDGDTETNDEVVFSIGFDPAIPETVQWQSQQFVPLYDRVNGVARTMETGGRPWSRLSPSAYYWTLFDTNDDGDVKDEADGRIAAWHKLEWIFDDAENLPDGVNLGDVVTLDHLQEQWPTEGREWRYVEPTTIKTWEDGTLGRTVAQAEGWRNIIVYRYAHAFISGAEAHFKAGNAARAMQLLNVLRERAYGDASGNFSNITFEDIVEEHARELGHEGHRWSFLKRNNILVERVQMHNVDASPNVQDRHRLWPIPLSFIDQTGSQQNPGY
ncbi:hypothetical protein GGR42_002735 [Saonia flava]|uniref:RagB/SusD family nutrient uptake outer membrane protein n=1 Tax=Saonia flava TaxID=523696 RepID=A0A846R4E9_9FLAO|nr:RagB/SusD family nutrient uptake outer membrane protein [Saonia flava]NJB72244.1 hypothetical protein [Saonia flava]